MINFTSNKQFSMKNIQKYYDISKKFGFNRGLFEDLTGDLENFPTIKKECFAKILIEIVEKTLRDFSTIATNYFKDAKIGIKRKDECNINYYLYCAGEHDDEDDHEFLKKKVEKAMNVKRIIGKIVHLNNQDNSNTLKSSTKINKIIKK
ncbi:hypothetical protein ACTFIR_006337 [Dictyostelium discoideum]